MDPIAAIIGIFIGALIAWILPWPFALLGYLIVAVIGVLFLIGLARSSRSRGPRV